MSLPTDPTPRTINTNAMPTQRTTPQADRTVVRPFEVHVPEEQLAELRRRIAATRLPPESWSQIAPRACSRRPSRSSPATGRPTTTGEPARRG